MYESSCGYSAARKVRLYLTPLISCCTSRKGYKMSDCDSDTSFSAPPSPTRVDSQLRPHRRTSFFSLATPYLTKLFVSPTQPQPEPQPQPQSQLQPHSVPHGRPSLRRVLQNCPIGTLPEELLQIVLQYSLPLLDYTEAFVACLRKLRAVCHDWARLGLVILKVDLDTRQRAGVKDVRKLVMKSEYLRNITMSHQLLRSFPDMVISNSPSSMQSWDTVRRYLHRQGCHRLELWKLPWNIHDPPTLLNHLEGIYPSSILLGLEPDSLFLCDLLSDPWSLREWEDLIEVQNPLGSLALLRCSLADKDLGSIHTSIETLYFSSFTPRLSKNGFGQFLLCQKNLKKLYLAFQRTHDCWINEYLHTSFPMPFDHAILACNYLNSIHLDGGHESSRFISRHFTRALHILKHLSELSIAYCSIDFQEILDFLSRRFVTSSSSSDSTKLSLHITTFFHDWDLTTDVCLASLQMVDDTTVPLALLESFRLSDFAPQEPMAESLSSIGFDSKFFRLWITEHLDAMDEELFFWQANGSMDRSTHRWNDLSAG
ncbi:hypothetical protein BT69DRAFT_934001 [Atractiella rhizophila]|nr:hypothetical protein BT69DRAFT_934001 [Atractiella rhizophila]